MNEQSAKVTGETVIYKTGSFGTGCHGIPPYPFLLVFMFFMLAIHPVSSYPIDTIHISKKVDPEERSKAGFGIGLASCLILSSEVDQTIFSGFNVMSTWHSNEWMLEFRGRFFFGELDIYQFETAGYRPFSYENPLFYAGGGIGYGGMNRKKLQISSINNMPFQGLLFYNGNGAHAFLGLSYRIPYKPVFSFRVDLDYMLTLYNIEEIRMPSGIRLAITIILNSPD